MLKPIAGNTEQSQARELKSAPLLDDQPSVVDLLNFDQFAVALREVMLNPQTKTPFIIGIFGRWGTGKSTLMRMLERDLEERGVTTVWFSAWLYNQEEEIWSAFLQSLSTRLARRLPLRDKLRFAAAVYRSGFDWSQLLYELPRLVGRIALIAIPVVVGTWLAGETASKVGALFLQAGGAAGTVALGGLYFLKPAVEAVRERMTLNFSVYRSMDFERHIGFLDRFRDQFARIVRALPGPAGRVVVFVDDLDRCGPEKALQLLDAIKVFLDVSGCVFVLGVDVAVIQKALVQKYPDDPVAQNEYLAKIVQLPFHLPPLTESDLDAYLRGLDVQFPDERCRDVLLACLSRNPRELKRVINTFALHWYLAQARAKGAGVTPVRLAKVVVIQQAFGRLFALLRDQPRLLAVLERGLRARGGQESEAIAEIPLEHQTIVTSPTGVAVPPSLVPFAGDPSLARLLTMHASASSVNDDANFAELPEDEIAVYFTLTRRLHPPAGQSPVGEAAPSPPSTETFPDFGNRYVVLQRIAVGGTSEVYLAEDRVRARKVAIKRLIGTLVDDPNWVARFEREIGVLRSLGTHPNLVAILDAGKVADPDGHPVLFYVMEYAAGDTLRELLERSGKMSPEEARRVFVPIFGALAFIHAAGIVHRDLKPASIVMTASGVPKLADFGLALRPVEGMDELTSAGTVIGTPAYMSPEQLMGERIDARADLFSLGIIILQALTGTNPIAASSLTATMHKILSESIPRPTQLAPELPPSIDVFMSKMLARNPEDRFPDAKQAKLAFEVALGPA